MKQQVPSTEYRVKGVTKDPKPASSNSVLGTRYSELFVIHIASGREWRGGQRQVCYLAQALATRPGIRQLAATGAGTRLARELTSAAITVAPLSWGPAFDIRALWCSWRLARRERAAGLVLHAHDSHALTLAAPAAARYRIPLVATRRVDFPIKTAWLWRRADRVVAISQAVRRVAERSGIRSERLVVVPSGIPLHPAPVPPLDLRRRLRLPADAIVVVSVGALVPHKDYRTLIGAAAQLRDSHPALHWVIAGEGPLRAELSRQLNELGLGGRVHLLGSVPDGRSVIAAADLFVASSREEGLNTSVLDAMLLEVPVVSTDAGGLPEALEGGAGLICHREDPLALARAVTTVLEQSSLRQRLISDARGRVECFSNVRMAEAMLSVYHSVARAT